MYAHWLTAHADRLSTKERARAESVVGEPTFRDRLTRHGLVEAITGVGLTRRIAPIGCLLSLYWPADGIRGCDTTDFPVDLEPGGT